jgi:hypothetical protein
MSCSPGPTAAGSTRPETPAAETSHRVRLCGSLKLRPRHASCPALLTVHADKATQPTRRRHPVYGASGVPSTSRRLSVSA